jgi:beta-lactamase class A
VRRPLRRAVVLGAALALTADCGPAQRAVAAGGARVAFARTDTARLRRALDSIADAHHGVVGYAVRNLDTGERLERRAGETFPTASLIKVAVLVTVYDLVAQGQLALSDPLTVLKIDQVDGSGVLQFVHSGLGLTVGDAAWLMSTLSDNTATNLLLDRVIVRRVWQKMEALGLPHTKVHSKVGYRISSVAIDSSVKYGLGVTTPAESARLFELLARGQAVSPAADSAMLDILEHNQDELMLARYRGDARFAHKTGAVDRARNDCGIFYLQSRVVACVLTRENADTTYAPDAEPHLTIARLGREVVRAWPAAPPAPAAAP